MSKMQEDRAAQKAKRGAMAAGLKARAATEAAAARAEAERPGPFDSIDVNAALAYAQTLQFRRHDLELGPSTGLNRPTLALMRHYLDALVAGSSAAVLQWPVGQRDVSILHPLTMLAILGSRPASTVGQLRSCDAVPDFRTLYYPWRGGGTGADQRTWLAERQILLRPNSLHLTRRETGQEEHSGAMRDLHEMLGHFNALRRRDQSHPHLAHPALSELYPLFAADGGEAAAPIFGQAAHELFGRVRYGAGIDRLPDHRATLTDPKSAPFGFYGITRRADPRAALRHDAFNPARGGRAPDICVLDLCYPGLNRLGYHWEELMGSFLELLLAQAPKLPILAVTQDAYVQRRIAAILRQSKAARQANRTTIAQSVLIRASGDIVVPDPVIERVTPIEVEFQSIGGASVAALNAIGEAASGSADRALAGALRRSAANLRRAAALPSGLSATYDALCEIDGQAAAEAFLEQRSEASVLSPILDALATGVSGAARERLLAAESAVRAAYAGLDAETPIGSALAQLATTLARASTFGIVVFSDETDLRLAEVRLAGNAASTGILRRRMERGQTQMTHAGLLEESLAAIEVGPTRNSWKRLILVAPRLGFLDKLMARGWLPEQMLILCDRAFATRVAGSYAGLAKHQDFGGQGRIGDRLRVMAAAAKAEAEARNVGAVDLELSARPPVDVPDTVIDMTDGDSPDRDVILIRLESGRELRAWRGSAMIRHNRHAAINPYDRASASQLRAGDAIVVPDRAFVDAARRVLPVHVLAQGWVKIYHDTVVGALATLPGNTLGAKARTLHARLQAQNMRATSVAAVQEWLRAEEHRADPAERLRPHAPQARGDFDLFTAALSIPAAIADKMWNEGIDQLRVGRRRAGARIARAFISVLVDPHGAAADLDADVRSRIAELRDRAVDHLDIVADVRDADEGHMG
ncbi:MAG: hypothetical protein ABIQ32_10150 [Sphingomicrobium sp.]